MFCKSCGASLPDGAKFCTACGAPVIPDAPVLTPDPAPTRAEPILDMPEPTAPVYAAPEAIVPQNIVDSILTWGIVGLVCSFVFSILGIVFSAIAMSKSKRCLNEYGYLPQQAKTGRTCGIVGLVLGIIFTVIGILALIVVIAAMAYGISNYSYY